jgi:hypothetical protein
MEPGSLFVRNQHLRYDMRWVQEKKTLKMTLMVRLILIVQLNGDVDQIAGASGENVHNKEQLQANDAEARVMIRTNRNDRETGDASWRHKHNIWNDSDKK